MVLIDKLNAFFKKRQGLLEGLFGGCLKDEGRNVIFSGKVLYDGKSGEIKGGEYFRDGPLTFGPAKIKEGEVRRDYLKIALFPKEQEQKVEVLLCLNENKMGPWSGDYCAREYSPGQKEEVIKKGVIAWGYFVPMGKVRE